MGKRGQRAVQGRGRTLRDLGNTVYGAPARQMRAVQLPLWRDVGLHLSDLELNCGMKRKEAVRRTAAEVANIYQAASIPTVRQDMIERKVDRLVKLKREKEKAIDVDKRTGKPRGQGKFRRKKVNKMTKEHIEDVLDKLFEVKSEVPELEKDFYEDQKSERKLFIGTVDQEETDKKVAHLRKQEKKERNKDAAAKENMKQKEKAEKEAERYKKVDWGEVKTANTEEESVEESEDEDVEDSEFKVGDKRKRKTDQKRRMWSGEEEKECEEFLTHCDRLKVSETASSTLFNVRSSTVKLNQSQVHKKKQKLRLKRVMNYETKEIPEAIGFDER